MPLTTTQREAIQGVVQELSQLRERNDSRMAAAPGIPVRLEQPSTILLEQCRDLAFLLRAESISAPELEQFVQEPSAFKLRELAIELQVIAET